MTSMDVSARIEDRPSRIGSLKGSPTLLRLTRLLWVVVTLITLGLVIFGIPLRLESILENVDERSLVELHLSRAGYARFLIGLDLIVIFAHVVIASILFTRRSDDWLALLMAFALVANGSLIYLSLTYSLEDVEPITRAAVELIIAIGLISSVFLLYLYPSGKFVPRWTVFLVLAWGIMLAIAIFAPDLPISFTTWPLGIQILVMLIGSGIGVFSQIYRYQNVSRPVERQQIKWGIFGLSAAVVGPFFYFLPLIVPSLVAPSLPNIFYQRVGASFFAYALFFKLIGSLLFSMALLVFPISFTVAIFRYRLWEIDVIINRALVYGALTGSLILIFFLGVTVFESLFRSMTGEASQLGVVVSTLAIASLFNPLRARIQRGIDRRFYRQKYDAAEALLRFGNQIRDEVDLEDLSRALLGTVEQTVHPTSVWLWLRAAGESFRLEDHGNSERG